MSVTSGTREILHFTHFGQCSGMDVPFFADSIEVDKSSADFSHRQNFANLADRLEKQNQINNINIRDDSASARQH